MPAFTSVLIYGAVRLSRALAGAGARLAAALRGVGRRLRNRYGAAQLTQLDDHMLADIGLTRSNLRDAYSEPLWRDPTDFLARRASESRGRRRRTPGTSVQPGGRSPCGPNSDWPAELMT